jgi:hypothetical protein
MARHGRGVVGRQCQCANSMPKRKTGPDARRHRETVSRQETRASAPAAAYGVLGARRRRRIRMDAKKQRGELGEQVALRESSLLSNLLGSCRPGSGALACGSGSRRGASSNVALGTSQKGRKRRMDVKSAQTCDRTMATYGGTSATFGHATQRQVKQRAKRAPVPCAGRLRRRIPCRWTRASA